MATRSLQRVFAKNVNNTSGAAGGFTVPADTKYTIRLINVLPRGGVASGVAFFINFPVDPDFYIGSIAWAAGANPPSYVTNLVLNAGEELRFTTAYTAANGGLDITVVAIVQTPA